jgi:hypothetical protein
MNYNIIERLNKNFNEFSKNYIDFCSNIAYKKKDVNNDILLSNELMLLEVSIHDLVVQLQNITIKIDAMQNNSIDSVSDNLCQTDGSYLSSSYLPVLPDLDNDTNKLINKTMKDMMPLFFCSLMNNDKDSILNNNTFMQNVINTMETISNNQSQKQPTFYDSSKNIDDVD